LQWLLIFRLEVVSCFGMMGNVQLISGYCMHLSIQDLIHADVTLPTRFLVGRRRTASVSLRSFYEVPLLNVEVAMRWAATGDWVQGVRGARGGNDYEVYLDPARAVEGQVILRVRAALGTLMEVCAECELGKRSSLQLPQSLQQFQVVVNMSGDVKSDSDLGAAAVGAGAKNVGGHEVVVNGRTLEEEMVKWFHEDPSCETAFPVSLPIMDCRCKPFQNWLGMTWLGVPSGDFLMGGAAVDSLAKADETVRHVCISRGFWMSATAVTQAQYAAVLGREALAVLDDDRYGGDDFPMVNVTWWEADSFCKELTKMEQRAGSLPPGFVYRLPTEAEWEYACRAGDDGLAGYCLEQIAVCKAGRQGFGAVGRLHGNRWEFQDMLGLVYEWCQDYYAPYSLLEATNPIGREQAACAGDLHRVIRGGCFMGPDDFARCSARAHESPQRRSKRVGFRVVLAAPV
jgi:sulfatase modifying factor 1